jgi:hypothetical protein
VQPYRKVKNCLTATDAKTHLTAISTHVEDAMTLLQWAIGVANLVQGGEINQTAESIYEIVR